MVRLQKYLSEAGVASRRASEKIILEGRVSVNGKPSSELGTKVDPACDRVTVDGTPVRMKHKLYVVLNKPRGYICTRAEDIKGRKVGDLLPKEWGHLFPVGRLDVESEGLIFLTNDGDFCLRLTHPRYAVRKIYRATVAGRVEPGMLQRMTKGVEHEGEELRAERAKLLAAGDSASLVEMALTEGRNREVRRLFETQGLTVTKLERTQVGTVKLGELPRGRWRTLTEPEIKSLLGKL